MLMLRCRKCGSEVASDEKAKNCKNCNELFPFECAVCSKSIRPPIPDFPVERYFTDGNLPLCQEHYQRRCPECNLWFRADENPGFFLCPSCTAKREAEGADDSADADETFEDDTVRAAPKKSGCGVRMLMALLTLCGLLYGAVRSALAAWQ